MMQSNKPYQRVSEPTLGSEMLGGAALGGVSAGLMHAGFYGASKLKNQRASSFAREGLSHGYGSWKRMAFTYGTAMAADAIIHGSAHGILK